MVLTASLSFADYVANHSSSLSDARFIITVNKIQALCMPILPNLKPCHRQCCMHLFHGNPMSCFALVILGTPVSLCFNQIARTVVEFSVRAVLTSGHSTVDSAAEHFSRACMPPASVPLHSVQYPGAGNERVSVALLPAICLHSPPTSITVSKC